MSAESQPADVTRSEAPGEHVLAPGVVRVSERMTNRRDPETGERPNFRCTACNRAAGKLGVCAYEIEGVGLELLCLHCAVRLWAGALGWERADD